MSRPLPMTKGRLLALLLGVPVAFALIAWTGLTEVAYAGQGSYPVRLAAPVHGSTVSLSVGAGGRAGHPGGGQHAPADREGDLLAVPLRRDLARRPRPG